MKIILLILIGAVLQTLIEVAFLDVKFGHWYDRLIFQTLAGIYGMVIGSIIFKN